MQKSETGRSRPHPNYPEDRETDRPSRFGAQAEFLLQRRRGAGVGCVTLLAIFFVAVTAFGLAYQARPSYKIDVGDRLDRPYVSNFNTREPAEKDRTPQKWDGTSFRWTTAESYIDLPGIGSQPLTVTIRLNPSENPNPSLAVMVNDNPVPNLPAMTPKTWNEISFPVQAGWFRDGNLHLKLKSSVFSPKGDPRELGLAVDWIKVDPADSGQAFIRPPDGEFLPLVFTAVLAVLIFLSIRVPPPYALGLGVLVVTGFSYWLIADRLSLTVLMEKDFIRVFFFLWVMAYAATEWLPAIFRWFGVHATHKECGWLSGFFLLQFILLYFFQLHPQFISSDIGMNIHLLQSVQHGQTIFSEPLPNNQPAPYPPGLYYLLLPFTFFSGSGDQALGNLIILANSILWSTGVFLVFYLASLFRPLTRHFLTGSSLHGGQDLPLGTNWAALAAAGFYAINRYPFYIFSQGNHTNLFAAWIFLLFLCLIAGTLSYLRWSRQAGNGKTLHPLAGLTRPVVKASREKPHPLAGLGLFEESSRRRGPNPFQRAVDRVQARWWQVWPYVVNVLRYLVPVALLLLVFLSHYGTFLVANAFMLVFTGTLLIFGGRISRRDALYVAICWFSALALALVLYYYNFFNLFWDQVGQAGKKTNTPIDLFKALRNIYEQNRDWFGFILILATLGGILMGAARHWTERKGSAKEIKKEASKETKNEASQEASEEASQEAGKEALRWWQLEPPGAVLLALGITALLFALAEQVQGVESRYQLYTIPFIAILAGRFLGRAWRTGPAGVALVVALFLFQFLQSLIFWLDRVNYYFL
ncbi:MAG TPA: hypothetical protein VH186_10830 [Chloroflexia bacterium]|nr:hypothetical protein [Chloroflexia bacterium]